MTSTLAPVRSAPDEEQRPESAIVRLQRGAQSGRPILIPGALEPLRPRTERVVEPPGPPGPHLDPVVPSKGERKDREHEHEGVGAPASTITLRDRIRLMGLRTTEAIIRSLRTASS
jgi:hypothetical protein